MICTKPPCLIILFTEDTLLSCLNASNMAFRIKSKASIGHIPFTTFSIFLQFHIYRSYFSPIRLERSQEKELVLLILLFSYIGFSLLNPLLSGGDKFWNHSMPRKCYGREDMVQQISPEPSVYRMKNITFMPTSSS